MSGSNSICVATVLLDGGIVPMIEPVTADAAGGARRAGAGCAPNAGTARRSASSCRTCPALRRSWTLPLEVEGIGTLTVDTAYGGDSFVIVDAAALGFVAGSGARRMRSARLGRAHYRRRRTRRWASTIRTIPTGGISRSVFLPGRSRARATRCARGCRRGAAGQGRPLAHGHGAERADGGAVGARADGRRATRLTAVSLIGSTFTGRIVGESDSGRQTGHSSRDFRARLDHRDAPAHAGPPRSLARGIPPDRHMGRALATTKGYQGRAVCPSRHSAQRSRSSQARKAICGANAM